ncbi:hypothetical protein HPB48_012777 [Haemaphysalis longicornis]|uniref:Uncharacterized protein n=1 Tax=Haemaphysalis longicornis TaxID=44386 RepID=A0A9J6G3K8_HAELO|nr:hypothetical protein HPB48_012777 [Haemaphysalis longicornis]
MGPVEVKCKAFKRIFHSLVADKLSKIEQDGQNTVAAMWELTKPAVKIKAIEMGSCIKYEQNKKEISLRALLQTLTEQESKQPGAYRDDISTTKQKLEIIDEER